jgi:hypothetical protein
MSAFINIHCKKSDHIKAHCNLALSRTTSTLVITTPRDEVAFFFFDLNQLRPLCNELNRLLGQPQLPDVTPKAPGIDSENGQTTETTETN